MQEIICFIVMPFLIGAVCALGVEIVILRKQNKRLRRSNKALGAMIEELIKEQGKDKRILVYKNTYPGE